MKKKPHAKIEQIDKIMKRKGEKKVKSIAFFRALLYNKL